MSASLERYYDYTFQLLIHGYIRIHTHKSIPKDLCGILQDYIRFIADTTMVAHSSNSKSNIDPYLSEYLPTKVEYLLLREALQNTANSGEISIVKLVFNRNWIELHSDNYDPNLSLQGLQWINDQKLFQSLSLLLNCSYKCRSKWFKGYDHDLILLYLRIVIKFCKKGILIKYPLMNNLIKSYERYYFDKYVWKPLTEKLLNDENIIITMKKMMIELMKQNENYFVGFEMEFNEWNNADSMRMASLSQVVIMEYDIKAMEELGDLLEIMQVRFQALQKEFAWRLH